MRKCAPVRFAQVKSFLQCSSCNVRGKFFSIEDVPAFSSNGLHQPLQTQPCEAEGALGANLFFCTVSSTFAMHHQHATANARVAPTQILLFAA